MKKKFLVAGVAVLALSGVVFASGPMHYYDDVEPGGGAWYEASVYNMMYKGVFEANDDFDPNGVVNRAQMAVMLDRLYDAIVYPKGGDWDLEIYENDSYSIAYPNRYLLGLRGNEDVEFYADYSDYSDDDCSSALSGIGDVTWWVLCEDLEGGTLMEHVNAYLDDFDDDRNVWVESVDSNNFSAYMVKMVREEGYWSETVFVLDDEDDTVYRIQGAYDPGDEDFERYWRSFMLK